MAFAGGFCVFTFHARSDYQPNQRNFKEQSFSGIFGNDGNSGIELRWAENGAFLGFIGLFWGFLTQKTAHFCVNKLGITFFSDFPCHYYMWC
jgi:hypothetical protein